MCLDVGHAHIVAGLRGVDISRLLTPALDTVGLFHLHDNLGARSRDESAPGVDPLRLDLHLAPGAGTLPWSRVVAPVLERMSSPLLLEIHPPHRPDAFSVAEVTGEVLLRRWVAAGPAL
jgi:sugar phosphate isomerase/epimerase